MATRKKKSWSALAVVALVAGFAMAERWVGQRWSSASSTVPTASSAEAIENAFQSKRSDVWVEGRGTIIRELPDDNEGSRHQKFVVRVSAECTVLMAHNIDLADRVPFELGDEIDFRGEYEWNDRGGVVHWTHHDPKGRHEGGWIFHRGKYFR